MLERVQSAASDADIVELRIDCLAVAEIDLLLDELPKISGQYLITFRPRNEGGHSDASKIERVKFWAYALNKLRDHDFLVDYEGDIDFPLQLDPARTIVSLHDFERTITDLPLQFDMLSRLTGKTIKIAVAVNDAAEAIDVWSLLGRGDKNVIPIAMGEAGKWTRILGLAYGSPMTYAALDVSDATAPGQMTAADLRDFFRVKELDRETTVYGVVAGDTSYSLSPYMHNTAFKQRGLNSVFIPLQVSDLSAFMRRMVMKETREVDLNFGGFSVTNPHKQTIIGHLTELEETARKIGAVNTVRIAGDKLIGYNTDAPGFIKPLKDLLSDLKGSNVAVVGAGGAARACIYALQKEGADVTVLIRDPAKAGALGEEFGIRVDQLSSDSNLAADILVNATPIGTRGEGEDDTIAAADALKNVKLIYDLVYNPSETRLLREAKLAGAMTIGGLDMLVAQGARQFEIWTGAEPPVAEMRAAVEMRLK